MPPKITRNISADVSLKAAQTKEKLEERKKQMERGAEIRKEKEKAATPSPSPSQEEQSARVVDFALEPAVEVDPSCGGCGGPVSSAVVAEPVVAPAPKKKRGKKNAAQPQQLQEQQEQQQQVSSAPAVLSVLEEWAERQEPLYASSFLPNAPPPTEQSEVDMTHVTQALLDAQASYLEEEYKERKTSLFLYGFTLGVTALYSARLACRLFF